MRTAQIAKITHSNVLGVMAEAEKVFRRLLRASKMDAEAYRVKPESFGAPPYRKAIGGVHRDY